MRLATESNAVLCHPSLAAIEERVAFYAQLLADHPLLALARSGELPWNVLAEFAQIQYADSILWIPMLGLMKERVRSPRLAKAIRDNIADEAGYAGTSHVELARQFVRSLGIGDFVTGTLAPDVVEMASHWSRLAEPALAGWLLAAERLVPVLFDGMRPGFSSIPDASLSYLDEHIAVDSDGHSRWMQEAILEILAGAGSASGVLVGVDIGAREVFNAPDVLYAKAMWMMDDRSS